MSNQWYTIFGPKEWPGVIINTGDKKIDGKYYNVLGDKHVQLSASGLMFLVGGSGIRLISTGYVDASGLRAKNLQYQSLTKINNLGQPTSPYPGSLGSLVFKSGENDLAVIPNNKLVYNTGLQSLTMPSYSYGALFIGSGEGEGATEKIVRSFDEVRYEPPVVFEGATISQASVTTNALSKFTKGIQIYPNTEGFKGSILTHMGEDNPAEWMPASYLNAEGALWNRFLKRPIKIEDGRIIFYKTAPTWAQGNNFGTLTLEILEQEFGTGFDTIELMRNDTREIAYIKFAVEVRYGADQEEIDFKTPLEELFTEVSVNDPDGDDPDALVEGFAVKICTPIPWDDSTVHVGNGYAFSVTKGAYLDMQLGRTATDKFSCQLEDVESSPFRFKPSTMNSISIRPDVYTAFNMLGENIDFLIYGRQKTRYGNYDQSVFGLNSNNIPSGIVPAFKVDANVPDAASGNPSSGVLFAKFLDRAKVTPSGWGYDTKSKVMINTSGAYKISSLPTGTYQLGEITVTGYIYDYADLTVNSTIYSPNIITEDLFLKPVPSSDNSGKYITNALLTLDKNGKIISRIPKTNPTAPGKPSGVILDPDFGMVGNGELSIKWTAPESDGNSPIINYLIQFSTNGGSSWTNVQSAQNYSVDRAENSSTRATIKGLSALVPYNFRIAAQNAIGISDYSNGSAEMTPGSTVPKGPYNLTAARTFDETIYSDILLTWEVPQEGSSPIVGYRIEESSDGGQTWQNYNDTSNLLGTTYEVISGTESSLDYYYRVSAYNSNGQGAYSYVYSSGNLLPENDPELIAQQQTDVLSNWDFGSVLFTGVCPT